MKTLLAAMTIVLGLVSVVVPALAASGYDSNLTDDGRRALSDRVFNPLGGQGGGE